MATNQVCDICNDPASQPVHVVRVSAEIDGAVPGSVSTGTAHEIESCEKCWSIGMSTLSQTVREQLTRDIPIHRQVYQINDQISQKNTLLKEKVTQRDAITDQQSMEFTAAVNEVTALVAAIKQLEEDRSALLRG